MRRAKRGPEVVKQDQGWSEEDRGMHRGTEGVNEGQRGIRTGSEGVNQDQRESRMVIEDQNRIIKGLRGIRKNQKGRKR